MKSLRVFKKLATIGLLFLSGQLIDFSHAQ